MSIETIKIPQLSEIVPYKLIGERSVQQIKDDMTNGVLQGANTPKPYTEKYKRDKNNWRYKASHNQRYNRTDKVDMMLSGETRDSLQVHKVHERGVDLIYNADVEHKIAFNERYDSGRALKTLRQQNIEQTEQFINAKLQETIGQLSKLSVQIDINI